VKKIQTKDLTLKNLQAGKFEKELPEVYALKTDIENNPWHKNQNTFFHTMLVLQELEKNTKKYKNLQKYLNQNIDRNTRRNILFLAALFHDIAKPEMKIITKEGWTMFPKHEQKSAKKAATILSRINLTRKEIDRICLIIKHHDRLHLFLNQDSTDKGLEKLQKKFKNIYVELLLLSKSDTEGSNLCELNPQAFKMRQSFYEKTLSDLKI
jgi:UTP:GlnB (protein PII) uridylyltransferase